MKSKIIKQFQTIPGVGKSIAEDLWNMGLRSLDDLVGEVFRCAIYFATEDEHDPDQTQTILD